MLFSPEDLKETEYINPNGQLTEIREGISASPVNISTNADFNSILGSGGAASTPELLSRLVRDLGLDKEVSSDKAKDTIVRTQFGAQTSVENAFKTAGSAPQVNGATSPQAINTLVRSIAEQAATLQVTGAGLKAQAMSNIESGVVATGGKSLQENRDDFLNQRVNQYRYQLTPAERAAASTPEAKHPAVQRAQDEYIANNPGRNINDYQAYMQADKPDLVAKDTSWKAMSEESRARMLRSEGKERTVNMYEDDSFLNKMSSGNADQQAEADRFVKMTRESSARADDSYVNQVRRDDTYSEDVSRLQAGKDMTKEGIGLSGLASEINTGTSDIGTGFSKMSDIIRDANVDLKSSFDGISSKGGGGGRRSFGGGGGGGDDDDDDFKKKRDLMTYSQLSYSSMDNIIGNLSYPLMDQALMRPMLAGMASSEIMPGFVSNASGAEEIFNQITGYLPNLGEDIKELEMGQKSLKAVTGSYTASDQMIAHATEIAKAEPIQFGTAVQAFTSFSAFPGTRDEVKGSPQFRESLTDVIQRLAILVPEQGEQGASFALREVMSGQYKSLKQRFNMDLPQLTKAAGEPNMSAAKFENLSGARQIDILQKGLRVMTGEDALAERSLTTSVQAGDIKDSLMQSIALKFIQPKESTPLGMSKEESSRMRDVFYERNKRTMGTRLTDQQLYDRTDVQLETAQRSPIGRMAVGMQGMVDVLQTTMNDKGIGSSIEKTITSNIFKPLMEVTSSSSSGDKSGDVSSSGNKLVEAIETLTKGVKQSSKELVNNPELQKILRSGIDAGVDVMTTTLAPGLGYGMSAGATKAWGAFMNPSNVGTMLGGALSTVSSPTSNWSDSLTTLAPMAMMLQTGLGEGSKKFGFSSKEDYERVKATPEANRTLSERRQLRASNFGRTISPQASIQAAVGASIMAGGIQGMVSNDANLITRGVSAGMTGIGGFAMLSSFTNTPLGEMWGRNPALPPPGTMNSAGARFKSNFLHKGMMGPGLVAGAGVIAVGAKYLDEQRRLKELAKGEESFGTQYGGLEETDPALYAKLMKARNDTKSSPKFGAGLSLVGAGIGGFFGGIPGAAVGMGIGGMAGTSLDSMITGKRQEKLKVATGEADSLISYRASVDAAYDATRTTSLAQTGDTSAIARDLQTSYDINRKGFRGSVDEKLLNLESERESVEAGFNSKSKDGGWRKELNLTEDTGKRMSDQSAKVDGKPSLSLEDANKQVMKFETDYGAFISDSKNKNILSGLDQKEISALTKAGTNDKGEFDTANNKEWKGKAAVAVEDLGEKGISTTADELERFIKLIGTLGVDLGKIQGGKDGKSKSDEVVTNASSTNDKLQEIAAEQNKLLEEKINTKDAEFFITGKDKTPDFFKTDPNSFEGETVYQKKMRMDWTPEEYQSKETAAEKMSFLQKVGEGAQAAKDQYDQKMDYAQRERQSGEGYFTGYTPDVMKEVQSGLQRSLVDLYASSGDKGAQELQGIRKERETRVEKILQDQTDGKPLDREGLQKELLALKGNGGSYKLRQRGNDALNQGLGDGVANPDEVIDHVRSYPGSSKPNVTGGTRYAGNKNRENEPSAEMSEDEKKWLEKTGGKSQSAKISVDGRDIAPNIGAGPGGSIENAPPGSAAYINNAIALADEGSAILGDSRRKDARVAAVQPQKGDTRTAASQPYIDAYSNTTDRFSANWKEGQHVTPLEKERRYDIAEKGVVVDAIDGDTVMAAGARGVTPVRLISDTPDKITNKYGQKRNTTRTQIDSPEILKFKGEDALVQENELGDKLLTAVLGVDTQGDLNMRSLGAAKPEDKRRALADLTEKAKTPEQIAALKQVMGFVDHQTVVKAIAEGGVGIKKPREREFSKGRPAGSLVKSDGSLVTDDLLSGGDSESSRTIRAFGLSNPDDPKAREGAIERATGRGEKELLKGENDQYNSDAFKKSEALKRSEADSDASPLLDIKRVTLPEKQDIYKKAEDKNVEALFGEGGPLRDYYTKTDETGKQTLDETKAREDLRNFQSGETNVFSNERKGQYDYYNKRGKGPRFPTAVNPEKTTAEGIETIVAAILEKTDTEFTQPALSKDVVGDVVIDGLDFLPYKPQDVKPPPWLGQSTATSTKEEFRVVEDSALNDRNRSKSWWNEKGQSRLAEAYVDSLPSSEKMEIPILENKGNLNKKTDVEFTQPAFSEDVVTDGLDFLPYKPQDVKPPPWLGQSTVSGHKGDLNEKIDEILDPAVDDRAVDDRAGVKSWWNEKSQARLSEAYADTMMSSEKIGVRGLDDKGNLNEKIDWYQSTGTGILTDPLSGADKKGGAELSADQYVSTKVLGPKEFGTSDITDKSSGGPSDLQKLLGGDSGGDKDMSKNATMVADTLESLNSGLTKFAASLSGLTGAVNNSRRTA